MQKTKYECIILFNEQKYKSLNEQEKTWQTDKSPTQTQTWNYSNLIYSCVIRTLDGYKDLINFLESKLRIYLIYLFKAT